MQSHCLRLVWILAACIAVVSRGLGETMADPRRPAAIEAQNVPAVPAALAERLRQYDNIRAATFSSWAPDGRGLLIATQFGNSTQLHRVYEPGGRREQITFFNEPTTGRFISKDPTAGVLLSFSSGGSENNQVYWLDTAKFTTAALTDGKSRNLMGPISRDGRKFALGTNKRNGRDTDWYVADCRKPEEQELLLKANNDFWEAEDWSPDGTQLLVQKTVSANESYPAIIDVKSKKMTMLPLYDAKKAGNAKPEPAAYENLRFSADGQSVYLTSDADPAGNMGLMQLDLKTGVYTYLSRWSANDVDSIDVDPNTGAIAYTVNINGRSKLYVNTSDKRRLEPSLPDAVISGLTFSPDGKHLGFTLAKSDAPADVYSLELSTEKLTRWTYSEVGGLDPGKFVEATEIRFPSFDERSIPAWMFRSRTAKTPSPVVIQIHGGPESQYHPIFSASIQYYVGELGLTVICPNVRGSSGYGKEYLKADDHEKREDSVKDIGALLDWIAQQPELDAKRVAVEGGSYGGYMVLASLVHYSDRIKAGIDIVGIANFITFLEHTAEYRRDLRRVEYGDERDPKMRAVMEKISPANNADRIRSSMLVVHGRNDPRVPFAEAQLIAEKVKSRQTVWTVFADNEGHGFAKRDNRDYLRAVSVMFLQQQLGLNPTN